MDYSAKSPSLAIYLDHKTEVEIKQGAHEQPFFHRHNGYELYLLLEGCVSLYIGKEYYYLTPGSLLLLRPHEYHRMVSDESAGCYRRAIIYLLPQYLNTLSTHATDLSLCFKGKPGEDLLMACLTPSQCTTFLEYAQQLEKHLQLKNYGDDLRIQVTLIELMLFINAIFTTDTADAENLMPQVVSDTMTYVEQHLAEDFTIEQLAKDLYHNRSYISRIFRESTGRTLQQYIIDKRILLAENMLENGESISGACYKSGFRNYANFIRTFTKNVGTSPLRYQKEYLKSKNM